MIENHRIITIYGRKPVLEVLQSDEQVLRLHMSRLVNPSPIINEILDAASTRNIEVRFHSKRQLSFISKNSRQDQGVALDLAAPNLVDLSDLPLTSSQLIALDGITNPQNLGMIIRSVAASPLHGLILSRKGNAGLGPLVFKASAGTVIRANIFQCDDLVEAIGFLQHRHFSIYGLAGNGSVTLDALTANSRALFILGNETEGLSGKVMKVCDQLVNIPMANNVESLNVSAVAALVAFRQIFHGSVGQD